MVKQRILDQLLIIVVVVFVSINRTSAICCRETLEVHFVCKEGVPHSIPHHIWLDGRISCKVNICRDGTVTASFFGSCGVNVCNPVGCGCNGGCKAPDKPKEESLKEFKRVYKVQYAIVNDWHFNTIFESEKGTEGEIKHSFLWVFFVSLFILKIQNPTKLSANLSVKITTIIWS